jgi:osmotically-inducible protein OsmY
MDRFFKMVFIMVVFALGFALPPVKPAMAMSDKVIKQRIENEAAADHRLKESMVTIDVMRGFVILRGKVSVYIKKMLLEQIAWTTVGVIEVENEIRVIPALPVTDDVIKRQVMDALHAHQRFADINAAVVVEAGVVFIQAIFKDPHDVQKLKHKVAEIQGVREIRIQAEFVL